LASNESLVAIYQTGTPKERKKAGELLIKQNKGLIMKYVNRYNKHGYDPDSKKNLGADGVLSGADYYQEACIGLLVAADKYDPSKGTKFATHMTWWIMQAVNRFHLNTVNTIRIPVNAHYDMKLGRVRPQVKNEPARIVKSLDEKIKSGEIWDNNDKTFLETFDEEGQGWLNHRPLKAPQLANEVIDYALSLLGILKPREQRVMALRYGFDIGSPRTLEEVGQLEGVSRERVRQIQYRSEKKIRSYAKREGLQNPL